MCPVIAKIEDELELVSLMEQSGCHSDPLLIECVRGVRIREADLSSVHKHEVVQMRKIPTREVEIDRIG